MPAGFPLFRPSNITSGLVGYWKLDEASGSRADSSGNGNTLTDNNTVASTAQDYWKTGENSADFEASNSEYLSIASGSQTGLNLSGSFSLACFAKFESDASFYIYQRWASNVGYGFARVSGGAFRILIDATTITSSTTPLSIGKWTHLCAVFDTTNNVVNLYVDGNLIHTASHSSDPTAGSLTAEIGRFTGGTDYMDGLLKDVGVWSVALTPIQIKSLALGVDLSLYTYRPNNVSTQPTAWWKLNETSGTRNDSIGSNHLTDNNTVTALGGYIEGVGADFEDANSERLTIAHASQTGLSITGSYAVSLWMKPESNSGDDYIIGKWTGSTGWAVAISSLTSIKVIHNATTYTFSKTLVAGTWYHVVVNYNSSAATLDCYVDGELVSQSTSVATISTNSNPFEIGAFANGSNFYDGVLSDVAFWSGYNLTTAEIKSLACGIPLQQTGLVSYWKLDETSGNRADSIGSNTLTDNNTVLSGTGKVSNAADFEASNSEYLSVVDNSDLRLTTDFTFMFWFKMESNGSVQYLVDKDSAVDGWGAYITAGNVFRMDIASASLSGTTSISTGTWYHGVGLWDGATRKIYINSSVENSFASTTAPSDATESVRIGAYKTPSNYFDGLIDEFPISKRWFRDEEIKTIYCKGLAGKELTSSEIQLGGNQIIWFL